MAIEDGALLSLGERIRQARKASGYGQRAFAAAVGVSQSYLSEVERGKTKPSVEIIIGIASCCPEISLDWLLTGLGFIERERAEYIGGDMTRRVIILEAILLHIDELARGLPIEPQHRAHFMAVTMYRVAAASMQDLEAKFDAGEQDPAVLAAMLRQRFVERLQQP